MLLEEAKEIQFKSASHLLSSQETAGQNLRDGHAH